jgi:hypothetical protein
MTRRIPEEVAATEEEILAAIEALTTEEALRLRAYARSRAGILRKAGLDKGDEDLFQIAVKSLLSRRRRWNRNSGNFVDFMLGTIKSISSNWCRALDPDEPDLEADLITLSDSGRTVNPLAAAASPNPNPEETLINKERLEEISRELDRIELLVAERPLAALIVAERRRGTTGPEIQEALSISQTDYETETRWIYRSVRMDAARERERAE